MNFGQAIELLKQGKKVERSGWNGKNMYLWLDQSVSIGRTDIERLPVQETVFMRTAQNNHVAWLASQTDFLADDWAELEN